ncbi:MAG: hypothetical protein LBM96_07755, partial [Methanobrevibacter sp.]|nr:hypothetical protein [Candidatus Methanoflexus mossambicus]
MSSRKTQEKYTIYDKDIYIVYLMPKKWSVIIMPENIIIDNHHVTYPHIHHNPKKHYQKTKINLEDPVEVHEKVIKHIEK